MFPETVGTALDRGLHSALHEQRAVEFEAYAPTTQSWVEVRASPSKDGLSVSSHDISARPSLLIDKVAYVLAWLKTHDIKAS